jgi:aldehyde dehydrogenase (NAD+)
MLVAPPVIKDDVSAVKTALDRARKGFNLGKSKPIAFRIQQLGNLKNGLQTLEKEINEAVQKDLGREAFMTWFTEIAVVQNEIDHAIAHLKKWAKPVCVETPMYLGPAKSSIVYEPLGVVCVIGSWNFPIFTTLTPLVSVIAAGNCAVIKPSELTPHVSLKIK